jgi:hypothetical protein
MATVNNVSNLAPVVRQVVQPAVAGFAGSLGLVAAPAAGVVAALATKQSLSNFLKSNSKTAAGGLKPTGLGSYYSTTTFNAVRGKNS